MIVSPPGWRGVGEGVSITEVEGAIGEAVYRTSCKALSLSGGIDSALLLHFMGEVFEGGIIVGDGIDELMCGYYPHAKEPTEQVYQLYLRRLVVDHLKPLDRNSSGVRVHLPYLDSKVVALCHRIPTYRKVSVGARKRLMFLMAERAGLPQGLIHRRKYGFCDAGQIKG